MHWGLLVCVYFLTHAHVTLAVDQALTSADELAAAGATTPAECSAEQRLGTSRLPSVKCYSIFPAPDSGVQQRAFVSTNPRRLVPATLLQVSILAPVGRPSSSDALCGLDRPGQSNGAPQNTSLAQTRSTSNAATLEVRRGIDRRWLLTSSFVDSAWYTVMAWTNASLRVLFDPSCSISSDQRFVQQYIPAWSICQRFANGSSVQFERWNGSTLFAQDRRLAPYAMLPSEYECSDEKDYELLVSAADSASTQLTVTLYTRPGNDSCRVLCIAERCDGTFFSDHSVGGDQSLRIRYKIRSAASKCDSGAYTGFALVLQVNPSNSVIALTTYEMDSPFNALDVSSMNESLLIIGCVVGAAALVIIVVLSIVIARWRERRSRQVLVGYRAPEPPSSRVSLRNYKIQKTWPFATLQKDGSRAAYSHAVKNNPALASASRIETGQNDRVLNAYGNVAHYGRNPTAAVSSAQLFDRATEMAMHDVDADEIYDKIDDLALSTEAPRTTTCSCHTARDVDGDRRVGSHLLADSQPATERASKPTSDKYVTLNCLTDEHPYSVPM